MSDLELSVIGLCLSIALIAVIWLWFTDQRPGGRGE